MHRQLTSLILMLSLSGCSFFGQRGEESPTACDTFWNPPPPKKRILPCENIDALQYPDPAQKMGVQDIVDIALMNNPQTHLSWANAKASAFALSAASISYFPTATGTLTDWTVDDQSLRSTTSQNVNPNNAFALGNRQTEAQIVINYLLADFGGRSANIDIYRQALLQLDWTFNRTLQTVIVNALRAYYSYLGIQSSLEAQVINVQDARKVLESAENLSQAGLKTHVDVLQAKSNLLNNESIYETLKGQLSIALETLRAAMGLPIGANFSVVSIPDSLPVEKVSEDVELLVAMAQEARPDLAAAYANVEQQRATLVYNRSQILPTVTASYTADYITYKSGRLNNSHDSIGYFALNVPITQLFVYGAVVSNAKANILAAEASYRISELTVETDVVSAYYTLKTSVETYLYAVENLKYASEAYLAMQENYSNGLATILDLLNAESVLAAARSQLINSKTTWLTSVVNLAYATGALGGGDNPTCYTPRANIPNYER